MRGSTAICAFAALITGALAPWAAKADIFGAVLPASRAVQVNATATAFATIINSGSAAATNCKLTLPSSIPGTFGFQTTDPVTNATTGAPNAAVTIAAGASRTFVFSIKPTSAFAQTDIPIGMSCDGGLSVSSITGVNTLLLTSSSTPTPDVVALSATISNDGISRTPGTTASTAFSVATVNVGSAGTVTASVDTGSATLNAAFAICQTNSSAQCLAAPAAAVNATFAANQTGTFSIFFTSQGAVIPLDPARYRSFVRFRVANATVGATSVAVQTQTALAAEGGSLQFGPVNITAPQEAMIAGTDFSASQVPVPAPLPSGVTSLNSAYNVTLTNAAGAPNSGAEAPVQVTVPFSGLGVSDPSSLVVLHYNPATGQYEPATIHNIDTAAQSVTFDSRQFSSFALATVPAGPPATFATAFTPATDGFKHVNRNTQYLTPGGNCIGMSSFALYYFTQAGGGLNAKYSTTPLAANSPSVEELIAVRAQILQSANWSNLVSGNSLSWQLAHPEAVQLRIRKNLKTFNKPIVVYLGQSTPNGVAHAVLAYAYDATSIKVYDPNHPGDATKAIPYTASTIGPYVTGTVGAGTTYSFDRIGELGSISFGGPDNYAHIKTEADGGFAASSLMTITTPTENQTVNARQVVLSGTLSGSLNRDPNQVAYWVNGLNGFGTIAATGSTFTSQNLVVASGANTFVTISGIVQNQPTYSGRLSNSLANVAVQVRKFNGLPGSKFRSTLEWGQNNTDVDLYVTEPTGATAWYSSKTTTAGMALDVDNTTGFGPENVTIEAAKTPIAGTYRVRVHYYSDHSTGQVVSGKVTTILNERATTGQVGPSARLFTINTSNPSNASPGSAGGDWVDIADVNVLGGTITLR